MTKALVDALIKLAKTGELPVSQFTQNQRKAMDEFIRQTGAVSRSKRGSGFIYQVREFQQFSLHLEQLTPGSTISISEALPDRARHIAMMRSSKAGRHGHDLFYPLLKAIGGHVIWSEKKLLTQLPLHRHTACYGAATLQLQVNDNWQSEQPLWLVENQALFDRTDWLQVDEPVSLLYYAGQLGNNLIEWLAHKRRASQVILFSDYDGVGLANYVRLRKRLGDQCSFWLMPNWKDKLSRFGNNEIWQSTLQEFELACQQLGDELQELTTWMRQQALTLEQEAVWL